MKYDLHIHSALSPCANDDMTPNNIVNMAMLNGLDLISVTDHNSLNQQISLACIALEKKINYLYGVEVQSKEEVHILAYFKDDLMLRSFNQYLEDNLIKQANDTEYFGKQLIYDNKDIVIDEYPSLLIQSVNQSIEDIIEKVHQLNGRVVLAHVLDRANSITNILGFIPMDLKYDGIEIKRLDEKEKIMKTHPWIKTNWFINSDAHYLEDIKTSDDETIDYDDVIKVLWG